MGFCPLGPCQCSQIHFTALADALALLPQKQRYCQSAGQYLVQGVQGNKAASGSEVMANRHWHDSPCTVSKLACFACSTTFLDKDLLVGSIPHGLPGTAVGDSNSLTALGAWLSGQLLTASLQLQSKEAAAPAWHFYRSPMIGTSTGSISAGRMFYYSGGSFPCCLSCSIKLSSKGHYLPCLCSSRGHFAPVFSDVTDTPHAWNVSLSQPLDIPR